ncbi:MAG: histidine phosphatase family protein [Paracoccaceae bacterium]
MTATARYLTHPQVAITPETDVRRWSLDDRGRARVLALAASPGALSATQRVISSDETKAQETAGPLARALGLTVETRPGLHENDRSATGFLPPDAFERAADAFFAAPDHSFRGWEPPAPRRPGILDAVMAALVTTGAAATCCSSVTARSARCCTARWPACRSTGATISCRAGAISSALTRHCASRRVAGCRWSG